MNTPNNLKYSKTHEWVEILEDNTAKIGLTDFAQNRLGKVVFVNLPMAGDDLTAGNSFGDVESVKAVSDIIAPVSGAVEEVNGELLDAPELINDDPYAAWLVRVSGVSFDEDLLDAAKYKAFCAREE